MVPDSGSLLIRDAEEPFLLESPTKVTGTYDDGTGVLSAGTLNTPQVSFEVPVLGGALIAEVDATFTQVGPTTGQISDPAEGAVRINTSMRVDLHIEVPKADIEADCVLDPVHLELTSTEPYTYSEETGRLTAPIADTDFQIPKTEFVQGGPDEPGCDHIVVSNVNTALFGPGHSLAMTVEGTVTPPVSGDTESMTSLAVSPSGSTALGQKVTLTASVADDPSLDPDPAEAPTGNVTFRDGTKVLGSVPVTDGAAVFETSTLRLGSHSLTAEYRGDSTYKGSTSTAVTHTVTAAPVITADLPSYATIGADPAYFDITTENPTVGAALNNARLEMTINRWAFNDANPDPLTLDAVVLEVEGPANTWTAIPFEDVTVPGTAPTILKAELWPSTGLSLDPGESITNHVRLSFPGDLDPATFPGPLDVTFAVFRVDPVTGDPLDVEDDPDTENVVESIPVAISSTAGRLELFEPGRIQTEVTFQPLFFEEFAPQVVRQGGTIGIPAVLILPNRGNRFPTGTLRALVDGVSVPLFGAYPGDLSVPSGLTVPVRPTDGGQTLMVNLPQTAAPGTHSLTIAYSGDQQYTASSKTVQFTVIEPVSDRPYTCDMDIFSDIRRFNVQLRTFGRLPASVPSGTTVDLDGFSFEIVADRSVAAYYPFDFTVGQYATFQSLTLDIGPNGSGSATGATLDPIEGYHGGPGYEDESDVTVTFTGEEASITVTGAPGEVVTPTLESITLKGDIGVPMTMLCLPAGEPLEYGSVTVAGTTLAVDAPTVPRADDEVTLTASTFPSGAAGTVEFYDGTTLLDIVAVQGGQAVTTVTLPEGERSLTARFRAGVSAPSTTSEPVALTVLPAAECDAFAQEGNAAVVRLVYLELLGRCPDQAGFDHWKDRLDDGTSPEVFAQTIARTREAVGRVVDDAYHTMLDRAPDTAGRAFWIGRLQTSGRYDGLLADLGGSGEFWSQAGSTRAGFVTRVYQQLLNRDPDPGGLDYWVNRLNAGASRRALVVSLANLDEPLGRLVVEAYDEILDRAPGGSERGIGIDHLRETGDRSGLYAELIGRFEFATRAGTFPNPED